MRENEHSSLKLEAPTSVGHLLAGVSGVAFHLRRRGRLNPMRNILCGRRWDMLFLGIPVQPTFSAYYHSQLQYLGLLTVET